MDGGEIFCMLLVYKCNTVSHTRSRGTGAYITIVNKGACVVMDPSSPHLPSSVLFQPVLSVSISSNVKLFDGLLFLPYTLGGWKGIFEVLEAEAQNYQ